MDEVLRSRGRLTGRPRGGKIDADSRTAAVAPWNTAKGNRRATQLTSIIVGAYREMPGLTLTLPQAARLFGLRDNTCQIVMEDLVRAGRLRLASGGQYASS